VVTNLDRLVTLLGPVTIVVFAAAWIYALICIIRKDRSRFIAAAAVGMVFIFTVIALAEIITACARRDVLHFLDAANTPFTVHVAGRPCSASKADSVLTILRSTRRRAAHHSHPTDRLMIDVTNSSARTVHLVLERDSQVPHEYWVYQTDYTTTSNNEIGRVVTPLFGGQPDKDGHTDADR